MDAREFVEDLIHPGPRIVGKLDLCNRLMESIERKADGKCHDGRFGERRIETALFAKALGESAGDAKYAPFSMRDVLSKNHDAGIALHLFDEGVVERIHHDDRFAWLVPTLESWDCRTA